MPSSSGMSFLTAAAGAPWFNGDDDALAFVGHGGVERNELETRGAGGFTAEEEDILLGGAGGPANSGIWVSPEQALRISTAYACRRVISEDVAKMPRAVMRRTRDRHGRQSTRIEYDHPVHHLLTVAPNDWMTPIEFVEYMVGIATFHRESYALVMRDPHSGQVTELLPLLPGTCAPEVDAHWHVTYRVTGYGYNLSLEPHEILRLKGPMADPWRGHATVSLAKEAVGLAAAIEAMQARFHANDMRPSGVLSTTSKITREQRDKIREAWHEAYGSGGKGGIAILDEAFKFQTITAEGVKSEVVESRKFQVADVCRFFRVFPIIIGHADGSQSFSSVEAMFSAHAQHSLHPWVVRLEQAMTLALLTEEERRAGFMIDIDMDSIMRGTPNDRITMYEKAVKFLISPNEARIAEGRDPLPYPEMDRPQLLANNTGLLPTPPKPLTPEPTPSLALPTPAKKPAIGEDDELVADVDDVGETRGRFWRKLFR